MIKQTEAERPTTEGPVTQEPGAEQPKNEGPKNERPRIEPVDARPWVSKGSPRPAAWVGFLELEEWARAVDPSRPVLLLPLVEPSSVDGPLHHEDLLVLCQQVTHEGDVLYCRLKASSVTRLCGALEDPEWREKEMAWESLWECAEGLLLELGLRVLPASVAWPVGQRYLRGQANGIVYDQASRRFARTPSLRTDGSGQTPCA